MSMVLENLEVTKFSEMDLYLPVHYEASGSAFATTVYGLDFFPGVEQEKKNNNSGLLFCLLLTPFTVRVV